MAMHHKDEPDSDDCSPMHPEKDTDPSNPCDYKVGDRIVLPKPKKRGKEFGRI